MKVQFIRNGISAGLAYNAEDIVDIKSKGLASALVDDGIVKICEDQNIKTELVLPEKSKPKAQY